MNFMRFMVFRSCFCMCTRPMLWPMPLDSLFLCFPPMISLFCLGTCMEVSQRAAAGEGGHAGDDLRSRHLEGDLRLAVLAVGGVGVLVVGPRRALEVPGVIGIAPAAVEVAEGRADEDGRQAGGNAFALERVEDFRAVVEAGEKHGGKKSESRKV